MLIDSSQHPALIACGTSRIYRPLKGADLALGIAGLTAVLYLAHLLGVLPNHYALTFSLGFTLATGSGKNHNHGANSMTSKLTFTRIGLNLLLRSHGW